MDTQEQKTKGEHVRGRHGMRGTKLYHIWVGLSGRCLNPKNKDYKYYGGRGITVCDEWRKPENFFGWAFLNGYSVDLSIDRIDTNKGYYPDNCRWVTQTEQQRNKRNNRLIEYNGETHCVAEWAEITGMAKQTIDYRLKSGWTPEEIITIKPTRWNTNIRRTRKNGIGKADEQAGAEKGGKTA